MTRIVDASVAVALFVDGERTAVADALFAARGALLAPELLVAETANALWVYERAVKRPSATTVEFVERLCERIQLVPVRALVRDAVAISNDLDHPVYDAFYLALAKRENAPLVTFDQRLVRKIAGTKYASLAATPR